MKKKNCFFVGIFKVTDEKSRIRKSVVRVRGSGSVPKCHGSTRLGCEDVLQLQEYSIWPAVTQLIPYRYCSNCKDLQYELAVQRTLPGTHPIQSVNGKKRTPVLSLSHVKSVARYKNASYF